MNLTLKQLEAFVWVCDLGSFRRAAERLNTTQPNVSSRIAALERIVGARLMQRDAGSVRITSKGRALLQYARDVLRSADQFVDVAGRASLTEGVLKLGVTELIVDTWLRNFLRLVKQEFPHVTVELTVDLSVRISESLIDHSLDLALQSSPFARAIDGTVALGTYNYVWVAAPSIKKLMADAKLNSLVQFPILTHARGTLAVDEIEKHFAVTRKKAVRLVPSSNMAACLHMAVDGLGIAVLPEAMVRDEVKAKRLQIIEHAWVPKPLKMCARYHTNHAAAYVSKIALLAKRIALEFENSTLSND